MEIGDKLVPNTWWRNLLMPELEVVGFSEGERYCYAGDKMKNSLFIVSLHDTTPDHLTTVPAQCLMNVYLENPNHKVVWGWDQQNKFHAFNSQTPPMQAH